MKSHVFIWENVLKILSLNERLRFRQLSKWFDVLVLRTITDFIVSENDNDRKQVVSRFGPYTRHLTLDAFSLSVDYMSRTFKDVNSITIRGDFFINHYDSDNYEPENHGITKLAQGMKLESVSILIKCLGELANSIIANKDLSSFAYECDEGFGSINLERMSFKRLQTLKFYGLYLDKTVLDIIEKKANKLVELELVKPVFEEDEIPRLPSNSGLKIVRFYLDDEENDNFYLNNPEDLPNLIKLDLYQGEEAELEILDLKVWPQIISLRLYFEEFKAIDFKRSFPNLRELSYNLDSASASQTRNFFTSLVNLSSLYIICSEKLVLNRSINFSSLTCLSLTFKSEVHPGFLKWISDDVPNLKLLAVNSDVDDFEETYLDTECHFGSLLHFIFNYEPKPDYSYVYPPPYCGLSDEVWPKLVDDAPNLIEVFIKDWMKLKEDFCELYPHLIFSPDYNLEEVAFPKFTQYYH